MDRHVEEIAKIFSEERDDEKVEGMIAYMKGHFSAYGITAPRRRSLVKSYFQNEGYPTPDEFPELLSALWDFDEREMQLVGTDLVRKLIKQQPEAFIDTVEALISRKSWWDTVDALSIDCGTLIMRFPVLSEVTDRWIKSENMWLQRAAILHQLMYKEKTDWEKLKRYVLETCGSTEFFLRKAGGWALRQYSRSNPEAVRQFLDLYSGQMSGLALREASKYFRKS